MKKSEVQNFFSTLFKGVVISSAMAFASLSTADSYPSKPVSVIAPYAAGGSSDVVARLISQSMATHLGQPMVVDNKAGAGATIGTGFVAKKGQNGYSLLLADNAQAVAPATYKKLSFNPIEDFSMVGLVGVTPVMLFASTASGIKSLSDLIERAKSKPNTITIGTGYGSPSHLMTELLQSKAGIKLQVVPYKGASAALADMVAGHIDLVLSNPASGAAYVSTGKLVVLAQTGATRDKRFADVPTFGEVGVSNFDVQYWFALLAPSDTPAPALEKLRFAMGKALAEPEISKRLNDLGINKPMGHEGNSMAAIKAESDLWKKVVTESSISIN